MSKMSWTNNQAQAIAARSGPLLICAAAGSGKTAVLTERVARLVADKQHPIAADKLLIVTFSNAAAAEMKERIAARLEQLLCERPEDEYLQKQVLDFGSATIGTIHAFCLSLVRENFQLLSLPPDLRVADERELSLLRREVLEELLAARYESGDSLFLETVELFSAARNDGQLLATVQKLYDFTRAHPFCRQWLAQKLALYQGDIPIERTPWGQAILKNVTAALRLHRAQMTAALRIIDGDSALNSAYHEAFYGDFLQLEALYKAVSEQSWDAAVMAARGFTFQKLKPLRGYEDDEKKSRVSDIRRALKIEITRMLQGRLSALSGESAKDIDALRPKIETLFSLVGEFSDRFSSRKAERQILDFSDLEQYAIELLCSRSPTGEVHKTTLAIELQSEYQAIFIDEYQDVNEAQELIFSMLGTGGGLFMVGDVKQSIYAFRQANPGIFLGKKAAYPYYEGQTGASKIILGANFRSHRAVCTAINAIFYACMSDEVGQVDYDEDERLIPLGEFPDLPEAGVSLELLDTGKEEEENAVLEARYVASRIAELLESRLPVAENGATRPIRPRDIGILLRSPKDKAALYLKELAGRSIPAFSGVQSTFLDTVEISTVLALLQAINNPLLDISLVSTLMSPVFAATVGDIARIRLYKKNRPFYLAALKGEEQGDLLCGRFLADLRRWRTLSAQSSVQRLIAALYEQTGLLSLMSALEAPENRVANLRLLLQYARDYEAAGYRTLSQFLRFVEETQESGADFSPAALSGSHSDAVQVMSVHRSKGLEFPVVFLCDCQKRFNRDDLRQNTLLHGALGFACMKRDARTMSRHTTIPLEALRCAVASEGQSEEMRVLYVALTRAKQNLILTGSSGSLAKKIAALCCEVKDEKLPPYAVARAGSALDWLIMAALATPAGGPLREYAGLPAGEHNGPPPFSCRIAVPQTGADTQTNERVKKCSAAAPPGLCRRIEKGLSHSYGYLAATQIPTKAAVTALIKQTDELGEGDGFRFSKKPRFITHERMDAAMRGDAFHKYMLFADHLASAQDPGSEIQRLCQLEFLSPDEGAAVSVEALVAFYQSPLYLRMAAAERVEREYRFMARLDAKELGESLPGLVGEKVTIQGICDLLLFEGEAITVVDYKTDRAKSSQELLTRYQRQLILYADILSRQLLRPVGECLIYSTALGREIVVPYPK